MTYKLGIITMEDPRADQKNVSGLIILSSTIHFYVPDIHIFLQQTY